MTQPIFPMKSWRPEQIASLAPEDRRQFQELVLELERRERRKLQEQMRQTLQYQQFVKGMRPDYRLNWHQEVMFAYIQAWMDKKVKRLMLLMPPGHAKSDAASRYLTPYIWGKDPDAKIINATHTQDLATQFNLDVQTCMDSEPYRDIFPDVYLAGSIGAPKTRVPFLRNTTTLQPVGSRGRYKSVSIKGSITGQRANYLILDDMFKDRIEAESLSAREEIWTRYRSTAMTRIFSDASIMLVVTRWHVDDLVGRLLKLAHDDPKASQWTVVKLPAVLDEEPARFEYGPYVMDPRKHGEALWPSMYPLEFLEEIQATLMSYEWNGQYQQRPTALAGEMFNQEWLEDVTEEPTGMGIVRVRYWDKAGTEGAGAYTAGFLMAFDPRSGFAYLVDCVRGQWSAAKREEIIRETAERDAALYGGNAAVTIWQEQEPGSGGKFDAESTVTNLMGFVVHSEPVSGEGSKTVRAMPFSAYCENKKVKLVRSDKRSQSWIKPFLEEFGSYPRSKYKDQMDAASGAFRKLRNVKAPAAGGGGGQNQYPGQGAPRYNRIGMPGM